MPCLGECQFHESPPQYSAWSGYCSQCKRWVVVNHEKRRCPCCHCRVRAGARNKSVNLRSVVFGD